MKYIGVDAHSSSCRFSVFDEKGVEVDNLAIETNGRLLVKYVRSIEGRKKLTYEESELSYWLYEILHKEVDNLLICNPVKNRSYKKAKTDKLDARQLAKLLRGGFLSPVYHNGSEREQFRKLMSAYEDIIRMGVSVKNRHKSLFRRTGIFVDGERIYGDKSFLEGLKGKEEKFIGQQNYKILLQLEEIRKAYVKEIIKYGKKFKEIKKLKSIPGLGDIQAAKIVSQVIEPGRFRNKYKYYSYCGLVRHPRESGGKKYGSTRADGNHILKCVYKMAGHTVLRGKSQLRIYYEHLRQAGRGHKSAYNAVCRKLAAISLSIWRHNKEYKNEMISIDHLK